ncbi:MAG: NTP transferase domain-containing protein [Solobacterium sp.]|nr:NTP transferase domain-containing protein [Solobacterium sp.]
MNKIELDLVNKLAENTYKNQRELADACGYSLGTVNTALRSLNKEGYTDGMKLSGKGTAFLQEQKPSSAIILAAGLGMRMIPINSHTPKALIEVRGERLIERIIRQLHEADIRDIYVVVGFMKESFEYLIDDFNVKLIVNRDYASKNNFHSLYLAKKYLSDSYVIPGDMWCAENPFSRYETYSWYMVSDKKTSKSAVRVNRRQELIRTEGAGNEMVGFAYLKKDACEYVKKKLAAFEKDEKKTDYFWDDALYDDEKMIVYANVVTAGEVIEIDTYEQLREIDADSSQLNTEAIATAAEALHTDTASIRDVTVLKKGMTNRSFMFTCGDHKYIMRIPGEGTQQLINRRQEAAVYDVIRDKGLSDDIVYINPDNGYKITKFIEDARNCDPMDDDDVRRCMKKLRGFHEMKLKVDHFFDIFGLIDFYESLWNGKDSVYRDYKKTKERVFELKNYIDACDKDICLTHIDAVCDNFIMTDDIRLIDWEYAGMQDPHVDLAMFCIYAMYDREHVEKLIDAYFPEGCDAGTRTKIYCYIAACGLLWSNWCEYKLQLGVEFGEYALAQFRYAKDYYRLAKERME